jgi:hypothetical protein
MPALTVGDTAAAEGDPGRPGSAQFMVSLSTASGRSVCFNYSTLQGTAQVGVDFVNTFGSACLSVGTTTLPTGMILNDDNPTDFYTLTPCRILDTRLSGPGVVANTVDNVAVAGLCGVPLTAKSVSVNITAVAPDRHRRPASLPGGLACAPGRRAGLHQRPYSGGQRGGHPGRRREPGGPERHAGRLHGRHACGGRCIRILPVAPGMERSPVERGASLRL